MPFIFESRSYGTKFISAKINKHVEMKSDKEYR